MKKAILLLMIFVSVSSVQSQNVLITQLNVIPTSAGIDVNLKAMSGNGSGYLSHSYTITNQVINLDVCYWFNFTLPVLFFDHNFQIPLPTNGNYTLNVNAVVSTSDVVCDYFAITDTKTENFNYLSVANFENFKTDLRFFPNPSSGKIELVSTQQLPNQVVIFDHIGRLVLELNNAKSNVLDLSFLTNGVYYLKGSSEMGSFCEKIVIKK